MLDQPLAPEPSAPFVIACRVLHCDWLSGRLDTELYCWRRAEVHHRFSRPGYTWDDACRDVVEYRRRSMIAEGLRARAREVMGGMS